MGAPPVVVSQAVFVALADPTRRRILARLAQGPATTGQLADLVPISRPAVSQHLRLIQDAGLIGTETVGRHRWHELDPDVLLAVAQWANELAARHAKAPKRLDAAAPHQPTQHRPLWRDT